MTDHLREIDTLATYCMETAIELLPNFCESHTDEDKTERVNCLLIHLRAIQHELKYHNDEQRERLEGRRQ